MDSKTVYVIQRKDEDGELSIIGCSFSSEKAKEMIKEYYGEYDVLLFRDIRDSGIEWQMKIEWGLDLTTQIITEITLIEFTVDEV